MNKQLTAEALKYFRLATAHKIYAAVVAHVAKGEWSVEEIADRLGRKAQQIADWLESPKGWTLDRVSDLCLAMNCEPHFMIVPFDPPAPRLSDSAGEQP